ncbi:MAG: DUF2269 family protein [Cardiobacteriaceae bacterium]|nr:DUF2269 family protein [Cardiobacteriaceae bacterium]
MSTVIYRLCKIAHIIGLSLFLGSIFSHIVASIGGGPPGNPSFIAAREHISAATRFLTMPGLMLCLMTGISMCFLKGTSSLRQRWLLLHAILAVIVVILSVTVIVPAGEQTRALAHASAKPAEILAAKRVEDIAGAINILLTLTMISLSVFRPRLGQN